MPPVSTGATSWLLAAGGALVATFLAEFGDKSQLLTAGLTARLGRRVVLAGVALGVVLVQLLAVGVGALAGAVLPARPIGIVSGSLFVVVGVWLWFEAREHVGAGGEGGGDHGSAEAGSVPARLARLGSRGAVLAVAATFAVGEMGDKTQLTTVALASRQDAVATFVGACLGMLAANAVAVEVGARVGSMLPKHVVLRVSAVLFVLVGVVVGLLAVRG